MGMNFSISVKDVSDKVAEAEAVAVERALYAIGVKAVEGATDAISGKYGVASAVDTGRLRASISFITPTQSGDNGIVAQTAKRDDRLKGKSEDRTVIVGTNVEYAEFVHNGTSKMEARPFLREGIDKTRGDMKRQVEAIFKGEL